MCDSPAVIADMLIITIPDVVFITEMEMTEVFWRFIRQGIYL